MEQSVRRRKKNAVAGKPQSDADVSENAVSDADAQNINFGPVAKAAKAAKSKRLPAAAPSTTQDAVASFIYLVFTMGCLVAFAIWMWQTYHLAALYNSLSVKVDERHRPAGAGSQWQDTPEGRKAYFTNIYEKSVWGSGANENEPKSGPGSSMQFAWKIKDGVIEFVQSQNVGTLVDVGCGDLNWMKYVLEQTSIEYIGMDIVTEVVNEAQSRFPERSFIEGDAVIDEIPRGDLVITREVLQHLTLKSAATIVDNVRRSGAKWYIATHFPDTKNNTEIRGNLRDLSDYRRWNLEGEPFNLGKPYKLLDDSWAEVPSGVWQLNHES